MDKDIREGLVEICRERTSGAGKVLASEILEYLRSQGYYKLPPENQFRLRLIDVRLGGLTVPDFIEWLKSYE